MALANKVIYQNGAIREFEKPEVCEAIKVANANKWTVGLSPIEWDEREARLKKEDEKHAKAPVFGEVEAGDGYLKKATDAFILQANEIMRLKKKNAELLEAIDKMKEGNPALKESASQFNDALLDEQAKKIRRLGKEISKLNGIIHDKNAILSDVAEELRLTKIREKNLTEVGQKYMKENKELWEKLADNVVDKINANALKSAESALAYKDEVIETLDKELAEAKHELSSLKRPFRPDSTEAVVLFANAYAKAERKHLPCTDWRNDGKEVSATYILENGKKSKIALDFTGDEIIFSRTDPDKPRKDSLYSYKDKQLAEKDEVIADLGEELASTKKELEEKTQLVEIVRNASKDYCDYGVAANEFIKELANLYVTAGSKGTISNEMFERCKNYQSYGFPAKCCKETKKEIDDIARGNENKKPSLFRDDSVGAVTSQKDCSPNLKATVRLYGKDIEDLFKEIKSLWQE